MAVAFNLFGRNSRLYNEATGISQGGLGLQWPLADTSHVRTVQTPDTSSAPISVGDALAVPPVNRAMQLYSGTVSTFPLTAEGGDVPWLTNTFGAVTPPHRNALTVQDLVMHAASVWWSELLDAEGRPMNPVRVPRNLWYVDEEGYVCAAETSERMDQSKTIYIPALSDVGFLETGRVTVRHYHELGKQILVRSRGGKPLVGLKEVTGTNPTEDEIDEAIEDWVEARQSPNGSVAFIPAWAEVHEYGGTEPSMLQDARNAVRLDVANHLNLPASLLDGNNQTSDNYSNTLQNANEFLTLSLRNFLTPIEARLSQDDVTAPGVTVKFDTSAFDTFTDAHGSAVAKPATQEEPA